MSEKKRTFISVEIPEDLKLRLGYVAALRYLKISDIVRSAIRNYVGEAMEVPHPEYTYGDYLAEQELAGAIVRDSTNGEE